MQNSPIEHCGPMTASGWMRAVGAMRADGSIGIPLYHTSVLVKDIAALLERPSKGTEIGTIVGAAPFGIGGSRRDQLRRKPQVRACGTGVGGRLSHRRPGISRRRRDRRSSAPPTREPHLPRLLAQLYPPSGAARRSPSQCGNCCMTAQVHPTCSIGPHVTIGDGSVIEEGTVVGPGCSIGADVRIGPGSQTACAGDDIRRRLHRRPRGSAFRLRDRSRRIRLCARRATGTRSSRKSVASKSGMTWRSEPTPASIAPPSA